MNWADLPPLVSLYYLQLIDADHNPFSICSHCLYGEDVNDKGFTNTTINILTTPCEQNIDVIRILEPQLSNWVNTNTLSSGDIWEHPSPHVTRENLFTKKTQAHFVCLLLLWLQSCLQTLSWSRVLCCLMLSQTRQFLL